MKMAPSENTSLFPSPKFCNSSFTNRIFSDVAGDVTIVVDGESFLLHKDFLNTDEKLLLCFGLPKFPLVARCGKIRKLVADAKNSNPSMLELHNLPGGAPSFELAAKFCYGINFEINSANVAHLRCAAEYLEMTDDYHEENLIARTEAFLDEVAILSLEKSIRVLSSCERLIPIAEELGILERCVSGIAVNACKEQLVPGLVHLDFDSGPIEWWIEDLSGLGIDSYRRVVTAMVRTGVRTESIINSLMNYAQMHLKGIGKQQIWNPSRPNPSVIENGQRAIVETLVSLFPSEKSSSIPLNFLFGMLRMVILVDAALACRFELEKRISLRLEMVMLDDLLIPSVHAGGSTFDVDTVHRILAHFLHRVEEEEEQENENCGYESDGFGSPSHGSVLKVGQLVDAYLAEIASDPNISLQKFVAMIEVLPDYARIIDDGLYRAVDIYLKAHPMLPEQESKKLCKLIDCQKLSPEACNHAAQNDRLPAQMAVRVLYFEQLRLKNSLSLGSGDAFLSQKISSNIPSAAMSPRDNYASLRRENRELKLEISRMRVRLTELEKEQVVMKQGMMEKSVNRRKFLSTLSRGIGRIGFISSTGSGKQQKFGRKAKGEGKHGRSRRYSVS